MPLSDRPRIWCAISGHGYGHLAQVAPILKRLLCEYPDITIHVKCELPRGIIREKIPGLSSIDHDIQDVGLVQRDPFIFDKTLTLNAYSQLHENWHKRINNVASQIAEFKPDLIIGDIPYLVFAAAHQLQIPSIAIASLSWDRIIRAYFDTSQPLIAKWYQQMTEAYSQATLALLPTPSMGKGPFTHTHNIDPIVQSGTSQNENLRKLLNIHQTDDRPIILITTGGINGTITTTHLKELSDYHWLIRGIDKQCCHHIHDVTRIRQLDYADIIASVDLVIGKMGYNLTVETAACGVPFIYVTRGDFPDEPPLLDWFAQQGLGVDMPLEDFRQGHWLPWIKQLIGKRQPSKEYQGAQQAYQFIRSYL